MMNYKTYTNCLLCNTKFLQYSTKQKYCSNKCRQKAYYETNKEYCKTKNKLNWNKNKRIMREKRRSLQEAFIKFKKNLGCSICGYNKCGAALDFHHINPDLKSFRITSRGFAKQDDALFKELDKCILVCSNCHREIHNNIERI